MAYCSGIPFGAHSQIVNTCGIPSGAYFSNLILEPVRHPFGARLASMGSPFSILAEPVWHPFGARLAPTQGPVWHPGRSQIWWVAFHVQHPADDLLQTWYRLQYCPWQPRNKIKFNRILFCVFRGTHVWSFWACMNF